MRPNEFAGVHRYVDDDDWRLSESVYAPLVSMPMHDHTNAYITFVVRGKYDERLCGITRSCEAGQVLWHPNGESHAVHFGTRPTRIMRLEIREGLQTRLRDVGVADMPRRFANVKMSPHFSRLNRELDNPDRFTSLAITAVILETAVMLSRVSCERITPSWLRAVRERIHDDPATTPSLSRLAGSAGVHPSYLAREFRRHFGSSIGEYFRRVNCEAASAKLRDGRDPIGQIAQQFGYADQSHFTRTFKRVMGVTPRVYRMQSTVA